MKHSVADTLAQAAAIGLLFLSFRFPEQNCNLRFCWGDLHVTHVDNHVTFIITVITP